MKHLTALMLVLSMLLCVFVLTGCQAEDPNPSQPSQNNPSDPEDSPSGDNLYELVNSAMTEVNTAKATEIKMDYNVHMNLMGQESDIAMSILAKGTTTEDHKPVVSIAGSMSMMGQEIPMDYYYDGEWMYMNMYGQGYKMQVSYEEFTQEAGSATDAMVDLSEELFAGVTATEADGVKTVELSIDEATFETLFADTITELVQDVVGNDLTQVTTKDCKVVVTLKENKLQSYAFSFACEIVAGSDKVTYTCETVLTIVSIGEDVTVTPPEGYEDYPIIDAG